MFEKYLTKTGLLSTKQPQDIKNQWYIGKFQEVHGDRYDYYKVTYVGSLHKVDIVCKEHGVFPQSPNDHLKGAGCPYCQKSIKTKTTQRCIEDFIKVHGDTYNYQQVNYINNYTKVVITCIKHGDFYQNPSNHLAGNGCPKCQHQNQDTLYLLRCVNTGLIKIGITSNLKQRVVSIGGNMEVIHSYYLNNPRYTEVFLHKKYQKHSKFNPTVKSGGTEFFNLTNQQIQEIDQYVRSLQ